MKRRGLLKDVVAGTAVLSAGVLPYGIARLLAPPGRAPPQSNHLRPPGALKHDAAFVAACIGCGLCGEGCPPRGIRFQPVVASDALLHLGPVIPQPEHWTCMAPLLFLGRSNTNTLGSSMSWQAGQGSALSATRSSGSVFSGAWALARCFLRHTTLRHSTTSQSGCSQSLPAGEPHTAHFRPMCSPHFRALPISTSHGLPSFLRQRQVLVP